MEPHEFFGKLIPRANGCWEWSGTKWKIGGYGRVRINRIDSKTHRVAWTLARGPIPAGMLVCHHCDNPPCCNPDHLFIGTHADNIRDRVEKGRSYRGERVWTNKLTEAQVVEIRTLYANCAPEHPGGRRKAGVMSYSEIGRRYGVSHTMVREILNRRSWKHVP